MRRTRTPRSLVPHGRLLVLACAILACLGALSLRAIQLQALDGARLADIARRQAQTILRLDSLRADIRDRNGTLLAVSANVDSVAASPRAIADLERTAASLARVFQRPVPDVRARLNPARGFVWIKRWATPGEAERLRTLNLRGVHLHPERRRFYPNGDMAAAYLGFADRDGRGLSGLELVFDRELRGSVAALPARRDARGKKLLSVDPGTNGRTGRAVTIGLDAQLQHIAERALERAVARSGARRGTLVALDPYSGELLIVAEVPTFDPNRFWLEDPARFRARAFVDAFEPGSTLKPFTIALALEEGVVAPDEEFDCENGSWRVLDRNIRDFRPHGVLTVSDILRLSSNIGVAKIAERLGSARLVDGLRRFGFGERSGSGFPGEATGVVRNLGEHQAVERANLAFGQGISVTALQLASAGAVLANGGWRVVPRLARHSGSDPASLAEGRERVISQRTADLVMDMLRDAVARGTGRAASLPHHEVAGKTGTAQKVVDGRYSRERHVVSFLGIVPALNPRLVAAVVLDEPEKSYTGGAVAAPVFREVASFAVEQLAAPVEGAE
ncbi:MAG: penicillin-binding protein 2 [Myxococcota bacterium]